MFEDQDLRRRKGKANFSFVLESASIALEEVTHSMVAPRLLISSVLSLRKGPCCPARRKPSLALRKGAALRRERTAEGGHRFRHFIVCRLYCSTSEEAPLSSNRLFDLAGPPWHRRVKRSLPTTSALRREHMMWLKGKSLLLSTKARGALGGVDYCGPRVEV